MHLELQSANVQFGQGEMSTFITSFHEHCDKRSPAECVFVKDNA